MGWESWQRFPGVDRLPGFVAFNRSQIGALKLCAEHDGLTAILEDDIYFPFTKEKTHRVLALALENMPIGWEVLYLGGMVFSGAFQGFHVAPGVASAHGLVCTHGMIYNDGVPAKILKEFDHPSIYSQKMNIYDCFLANRWHRKTTCFVVNPMVAWQHAGYSDLSNQASVGTGMFELTQEKINKKLGNDIQFYTN